MGLKRNIQRGLLLSFWLMLGGGVLVLLVAAINVKNHKVCKAVEMDIDGAKESLFLDGKDIMDIISDHGKNNPRGRAIAGFDLQRLESRLENRVWVRDAELFFDNNRVLHVHVEERIPVARIFTTGGNSFYIDSSGKQLPLSSKMSIRLPVFTGFPSNNLHFRKGDSVLEEHIMMMSRFIQQDKFWMAQVAQIDINRDGTFELVPTVGHHIIDFGNGENYEAKFKRLFVFYKQVLSHTGFDRYSRVNVAYDNQVVATRKGMVTKIDSIQALKNMQQMIREAVRMAGDSLLQTETEGPAINADSALAPISTGKEVAAYKLRKKQVNVRVKAVKRVKKTVKPKAKTPGRNMKPKALMQKENN